MSGNTRSFVVTEHPPWYDSGTHRNAFSCKSPHGLLDQVASLILCKRKELSEQEKRFKPKTIMKLVKDKVIRDSQLIPQKPSRSLLFAVMDLLDMKTKGSEFSTVDKAGLKHVLLAYGNYRCFCVPPGKLSSPDDRKVIPVITQYSERQNFAYYDRKRSLAGTYIVVIPSARRDSERTYFIQEVLFVPGLDSLELLKRTTNNLFVFWDMALEVPTHPKGLTPSFQQIQPVQLLHTEQVCATRSPDRESDTEEEDTESVRDKVEVEPMCCVLDEVATVELRKKRPASIDCFTEEQIVCSLKHFTYENQKTRVVYFRRRGKILDGKRVHLIPVVVVKESQKEIPQLYVSTTVRFLRVLKECSVKGSGELVNCWDGTLRDFSRNTFLTGPDTIHQDIHLPALTAFMKRVSPDSWCNKLPKHVESMIGNPIMVEIVELAITFLEHKIPNPFGVAELLFCPIERVREYIDFWNLCKSDRGLRAVVTETRVDMIKEQMRADWSALADIVSQYGRRRHVSDARMRSVFEDLLEKHTLDDIAIILKRWHALVRCDLVKGKDKELVQMNAKAKVLFLKLRTFHNKVKEELRAAEGEHCRTDSPEHSQTKDHRKEPCEAQEYDDPTTTATLSIKQKVFREELYSTVIPGSVSIASWIKNMSTLLLCNPWLTNEPIRRDAVCTLLGLDATLLSKQRREMLRDWVIYNRGTVEILRAHNPKDRLSKALVGCLDSTLGNTRKNKTVSFRVPLDDVFSAERRSVKQSPSPSSSPETSRVNNKSSTRRQMTTKIKSVTTSAVAGNVRALNSRATMQRLPQKSKAYKRSRATLTSGWFDNEVVEEESPDNSHRSEGEGHVDEEGTVGNDDYDDDDVWGEDKEAKSNEDVNKSLDDKDYQGCSINDRDMSGHEDDDIHVFVPSRLKSKRIQHNKRSNSVPRRNVERVKSVSYVHSEGEDEVSAMMNQEDTAYYGHKIKYTDEDEDQEVIKPVARRVKYSDFSSPKAEGVDRTGSTGPETNRKEKEKKMGKERMKVKRPGTNRNPHDKEEGQVIEPVAKRVKYSGLSIPEGGMDYTGSTRPEKKKKRKETNMTKEKDKLPATEKNKKNEGSSSQEKPHSTKQVDKPSTCKYPVLNNPLHPDKDSVGYKPDGEVFFNREEECTDVSTAAKKGQTATVSSPNEILPNSLRWPSPSTACPSPTPLRTSYTCSLGQGNEDYFLCM